MAAIKVPIDPIYRPALVYYMVGRAQLRDDEATTSGQGDVVQGFLDGRLNDLGQLRGGYAEWDDCSRSTLQGQRLEVGSQPVVADGNDHRPGLLPETVKFSGVAAHQSDDVVEG